MRKYLFFPTALLAALLLGQVAAGAAPGRAFYVAPNGHDTWSGQLAAPNKAGNDGPFATLGRARDAVRALKRSGSLPAGGVTVYLRGGFYPLPETVTFTSADSGTAAAPITYCAYRGETPVLSGGRRVDKWRVEGGRWIAPLPEAARGEWDFAQLFVNGQRRYRPRLPRTGYYYIAAPASPTAGRKGRDADRFRFADGNLRADWSNLQDVEVHVFHTWSTSRLRIASIDAASNRVTFTGPTFRALSRGSNYLVENVKEALQNPGEWYLDRKQGTLTYIPRPGEKPANTTVIAPRLERLIALQGDIKNRHWVEHLNFHGLTFAHANWTTPAEGHCVSQAEFSLPAGIVAEGARDCAFDRCAISHMSAYALEWGNGCKRDRVESCAVTDCGGGGVKIGPSNSSDEEAVASNITVQDCLIAHCGRMHPAAVGIWLGYAHDNTLAHNEIYDLYYSGISAGWTWGYGATPTRNNRIEYNHIYQTPQRVLTDMGGIYTLGTQPGTVLRGNVIHDLEGVPWAVGIYLDEGSSNILVENNLVYRVTTHAFNVNYGRDDIARNNIFGPILDDTAPMLRCGRMEPHRSMTVERNIIYWNKGRLVDNAWATANCLLDNNLYWNSTGRQPLFGEKKLAEWQATGQDVHSLVANPRFANPKADDFRLAAGSAAARIGFQPVDWRQAGRLTRTKKPAEMYPRAFPAQPLTPPDLPPVTITQDYEELPLGSMDNLGTTREENAQATARVTDEQAASGKHSLKFTDAAGQQGFYNPHLFYSPGMRSGVWQASFALRFEPGALIWHEWRDNANPFHVGPSLNITADGWLSANGKRIVSLPARQWIRFTVTCGLGKQANGKYKLSVEVPGEAPLHIGELTCNPEFKSLEWLGFVSGATGPAVFYVDDVHLAPVSAGAGVPK